MRYRQLGASDLVVSEISLGTWLTYGVGVETATARACLDRAFELGFNFVDTANVYGRGAAESSLATHSRAESVPRTSSQRSSSSP
jgi:aryl-alcohol dehydrogenase-like predicted oxidoreductase